ncbi:hypothetical protein JCM5296_003931 [Sporobolomyces johnsonii]
MDPVRTQDDLHRRTSEGAGLAAPGSEQEQHDSPGEQSTMDGVQQHHSEVEKHQEESFASWLARYKVGRAGPSDKTPAPPASILAIIENMDVQSSSTPPSSASHGPDSPSPSLPMPAPSAVSQAPDRIPHSPRSSSSSSSLPSYSSISEETLLDFYRRKGHFPAPPGPYEEERLRLAHKYGLDHPVRRKAIDRICSLAKAHFQTKTVVISLTFDDHQVLGAERGWRSDVPDLTMDDPLRRLTLEPAFCTHAMLASYTSPKAVFIVGDADKDWRFKKPYTVGNGGGLSFYAAANVNLPVGPDADSRGLPPTLASGALCLIDNVPRAPEDFTEDDRAVLSDLAEMIAREFQLGFEQRRREQETAQSEFLGTFLHQALVLPSQPGDLQPATSGTSIPASVRTSSRATSSAAFASRDADGAATTTGPSASPPRSQPPSLRGAPSSRTSTPFLHHSASSAAATSSFSPFDAPPSPSRLRGPTALPSVSSLTPNPSLIATAASRLRSLTHAGSSAILDLRSFRSSYHQPRSLFSTPVSPSPPNATPPLAVDLTSPAAFFGTQTAGLRRESINSQRTGSRYAFGAKERRGRVGLMASAGEVEWQRICAKSARERGVEREEAEGEMHGSTDGEEGENVLVEAVEETLRAYFSVAPDHFENNGLQGSFVALGILPPTTTETCCIPVFDVDGAPALMIVLSSSERWFRFEPSDRRFAQSIGAIVIGSLLRERALASDRAKLAFISQVSHELRTPLHGINSQIELIREFSSPSQLRKLSPLLDVADVCLESLSDVLNDTLDFSKLTNTSPREVAELQKRSLSYADLALLVEGVAKSTWIRKQRVDLVSVDLGGVRGDALAAGEVRKATVDLVLEVEERREGWGVMVDVGGMKRVLLNIVGNALKFTHSGSVQITLRELCLYTPPTDTPESQGKPPSTPPLAQQRKRGFVAIFVRDTGIGMTDEFLRDGALFTPFKQANPFANGAGLGLSICDTIVKRMGGRIDVISQLGHGTEMIVTLPLDFVSSPANAASTTSGPGSASYSSPNLTRRIISDELGKLLQPGPSHILAPTPSPSSADNAALSAASPSPPHGPPKSKPPAPPPQIDFEDAVEAAHASLGSTSTNTAARDGGDAAAIRTRADAEDLVVEAAKLSISSSQGVEQSALPMVSSRALSEADVAKQQPTGLGLTDVGLLAPESLSAKPLPQLVKEEMEERKKHSVAPGVRVLFADDNPVARNILTKLLAGKGIAFTAAEDGQQAVDRFKAGNGSYSLFLADVQMPHKDGIEAAFEMRAHERQMGWAPCRIIALTGLSNSADMQKALGPGGSVDEWLVKGGRSLRVILEEIAKLQNEMDEKAQRQRTSGNA